MRWAATGGSRWQSTPSRCGSLASVSFACCHVACFSFTCVFLAFLPLVPPVVSFLLLEAPWQAVYLYLAALLSATCGPQLRQA